MRALILLGAVLVVGAIGLELIIAGVPMHRRRGSFTAEEEPSAEDETETVSAEAEPEEELSDDLELVAVIAAAIAASENTDPSGIIVRSIRRVSSANHWKRG